jgi:F-type H+-transporting ATPase subunit a
MTEQLWFTKILNLLLAKPAVWMLTAMHVAVTNPRTPIPNHVAMEVFVAFVLMGFTLWLRPRLSVENPGRWQHVMELIWEFIHEQAGEIIGHDAGRFQFFLLTLTLFILIANLLGIFPVMESPTANATVPFGLAIITFVYYHWAGVKKNGVLRYLRHFLGPMLAIAVLMLPIEIISHLARLLSLTVRLYANIFAGDLITTIWVALMPVSGFIFMALHIFVGLLQTYIWVLLTMVYLGGAVGEEHGASEAEVVP